MSSEKMPFVTSTPICSTANSSVLKEKQLNSNESVRRKPKYKRQLIVAQAKENVVKRPPRCSKDKDDKNDALKRQQAIEAIKMCEVRRLRIAQESIAENLDHLTLKPVTQSKDDLMEKKRLEAKRVKEKRIKAHLAEQEARKKKEAEDAARACHPTKPGTHRLSIKYRPKNRCTFKPMKFNEKLQKLPEEDEQALEQVGPPKKNCMKSKFEPRRHLFRPLIRYTKDEIRSLNPYGYYFM